MRAVAAVRNLILWHLFIGAIGIAAFCTYYQTTDMNRAGDLASMSARGGVHSADEWLADRRATVMSAWNRATGWRQDIQSELDPVSAPR